jgi:hypothetical protein
LFIRARSSHFTVFDYQVDYCGRLTEAFASLLSGREELFAMGHNRLLGQQVEPILLPQPPLPEPQIGSFIICPVVLCQGLTPIQYGWQWMIYQIAYQQAQAIARPSLPERDLLAVWN